MKRFGNNRRGITNVISFENRFTFNYLNHQKVITDFVRKLNYALGEGYKDFILDFGHVSRQYFPSTIVPLVGIIDALEKRGLKVQIENYNTISTRNIFKPVNFSNYTNEPVVNVVWQFDESNIYSLVDFIFDELEKFDRFPKGVISLASWSLNEVMDNVLNHSESNKGFVMVQLHRTTKHMAFCVYDTGIGIMKSFQNGTQHNPHSQIEAINLAIQEGVTSDPTKGQGNGLFGLHSLTKQGDGRLTITSGNGSYKYTGETANSYKNLTSFMNCNSHTCVDFVIDYSNDMEVDKVLTFNSTGYKPLNLRLEKMEDERGNIQFKIKDLEEGSGTRAAALKLKNKIMNILTEEPKTIILDFIDVKVITSSYADELIAKLLVELGLFQFNQLIRLRNLHPDMQTILQRSVIQRFITSYNPPQEEKGMG